MNRRIATGRIALIVLVSALTLTLGVSGAALGVSTYEEVFRHEVVSTYFDSCVRGQWREVEFSEESEIDGDGKITLTGSGRLVRFDRGVQTVEYGDGITYTGSTAWYNLEIQRTGTVSYQVRVSKDQLTFTGLTANGTQRILANGVEIARQPMGLNSAPLQFQCDGDLLILTDHGYRSVLERVRVSP